MIDTAKRRWGKAAEALRDGSSTVATAEAMLGIFYLLIEQADNYGEDALDRERGRLPIQDVGRTQEPR